LIGPIEFVGVTGVTDGTPQPTRSIVASNWVTLCFNFSRESVAAFTGDGVLAVNSPGILEALALVPADGSGRYTVYIDNVQVIRTNTLTYSLIDPPAGVSIDDTTGILYWAVGDLTVPATNSVTVSISNQVFPPMVTETNVVLVVLPHPRPSIRLTIENGASGCELRWDAVPGTEYQIQFKESLATAIWTNVGQPVSAADSTAIFRDVIPVGVLSRFYRVMPVEAGAASD
jgi:hypothetical protein